MRQSLGLSSIEFVIVLVTCGVVGYLLLPRFISVEPETYQVKWQETKEAAQQVSETLSKKHTYDRIEQEINHLNRDGD